MKKTQIPFKPETVPASIRPLLQNAVIYDSSCSEHARTFKVTDNPPESASSALLTEYLGPL